VDHCRRQHVDAHSYELDSPVKSNSIGALISFRNKNSYAGDESGEQRPYRRCTSYATAWHVTSLSRRQMKRTLSFVVIALATLSIYSRAQSAGNAGNNHNNPNAQQYSALLESFHRQTHLALDPIVRITSPLADSMIAPGEGKGQGNGSPFGTNFLVTLEMVERDSHRFVINEATEAPPVLGIRDVLRLLEGEFNLSVPGLYFFFDVDLITPDGQVLPAFQNFASAFNVAGSDDTPGKGVTTWLGWHVLESLHPGTKQVTLTAVVVDNAGRIGLDQITLNTDQDNPSGELLTPPPSSYPGNPLTDDELGPEVSMIAPRVPTSIAIGPPTTRSTPQTGHYSSFMFRHWTAKGMESRSA